MKTLTLGLRVMILLLLMCLTIASTVAGQADDIDDILDRLANNEFRASIELEAMGLDALPALQAALEDPYYAGHLNVIHLLGRMGLPETIPLLKQGLNHGTRVKNAAISALMKFDDIPVAEMALELILETEDYHDVALTIIRAAVDNDYQLVPIVEGLYGSLTSGPPLDFTTTEKAANVVGNLYIETDGESRSQIDSILGDLVVNENPSVRLLAVHTLMRTTEIALGLGEEQSVPTGMNNFLLDVLENNDEMVETKSLAASTLSLASPLDPLVIDVFVQILTHEAYDSNEPEIVDMKWSAVRFLEKAGAFAKDYAGTLLDTLPQLTEEMQWRLARVFVESGKEDTAVANQIVACLSEESLVGLRFYFVRVISAIGTNAGSAQHALESLLAQEIDVELTAAIEHALNRIN